MFAVEQSPAIGQTGSAEAAFIAADVGGTHVRAGLMQAGADGTARLLAYRKYVGSDFVSLQAVLSAFLVEVDSPPLRHAVIASAGYPLADGSVISANLPWPLHPEQIRQALSFQHLHLANDFEALAYALGGQVDVPGAMNLVGPERGAPDGPVLVLGPGTGLGAAVWIPSLDTRHASVLATEAGQASLAASNAREWAIVAELRSRFGHASIEHALSGPGLLNLYQAICTLEQRSATLESPAAVSHAGMTGEDIDAREALQLFCAWLGSVCGDLALSYGSRGGVYLAGGVLPHLRDFLLESDFAARFLDKGNMRTALQHVPVKLVEHGQLGVMGAARWFLQKTSLD